MRVIAWLLIAAYLALVGLWPAAAAPIALAGRGVGVIVGQLPGLLIVAVGIWLYFRLRPAVSAGRAA